MCRTANGTDVNFIDLYRRNVHSVIDNGTMVCKTLLSACQKDGRGNICPVTVILPTIAMISKTGTIKRCGEDCTDEAIVNDFLKLLSKKIGEAKDMLIERFEHICSQSSKSASFMWGNNTMCGYIEKEGIRSAIKHGTLAVGQLGIAESLQILVGCDHTSEKGMEVARKIEALFNEKCKEYKEEYKLNFGVYYTPKFLWVA